MQMSKAMFTSRQFLLEGNGFRSKMVKRFKGTQTVYNDFLKPAVNTLPPAIGMAVRARNKNRQVGQAKMKVLKSVSGGRS